MSWADTIATKALIELVPALAGKTWVTRAPTGPVLPAQYCIVHPAAGADEAGRFMGPQTVEHPEFTLHIVGATADQVQALIDLVKAKFVVNGFMTPPTVSGRRNWAGYWRSPLPIQTDNTVTPPLLFAVIQLGWTSEPA
jgi:hypothetical protein